MFWDASALAKRYFAETGSMIVNQLFANHPPHMMASSPWGYIETYAILLRRLNSGILDRATFSAAVSALQNEVVLDEEFSLLPVDTATVFNAVSMIGKHNLNATDAALLTLLLEYSALTPAPKCVVIAADQRLLRAATAEGFSVINPETISESELIQQLSTL